MRKRFLVALAFVSVVAFADINFKNEGNSVGLAKDINCVGPGIDCTRTGNLGIITITATGPTFTATQTDGGDGYVQPTGARVHFGSGALDFADSDAGTVTIHSGLTALGNSHVRATRLDAGVINGTTQNFVYNIEAYDTLGEYTPTTGAFVATKEGYYVVSAQYAAATRDDAGSFLVGDNVAIAIYVNGVAVATRVQNVYATSAQTPMVSIWSGLHLDGGDSVSIVGNTDGGIAYNSLVSNHANFLSIDRLP